MVEYTVEETIKFILEYMIEYIVSGCKINKKRSKYLD